MIIFTILQEKVYKAFFNSVYILSQIIKKILTRLEPCAYQLTAARPHSLVLGDKGGGWRGGQEGRPTPDGGRGASRGQGCQHARPLLQCGDN